MKKTALAPSSILALTLAPVMALLAASPAFAADLKNNDAVAYEIYMESADAEKTVTIEAHATLHDLCHNCYVEVVETGSALSVEEEENLTITDGQLSAE